MVFSSHNSGCEEFIFWDITPYRTLKINRRFGGICCLHIRVEELAKQETNMKLACCWFLTWLVILAYLDNL
jgi:hypothetical protein